MTVVDRLTRVRPGTRIRLFWLEKGEKRALSGTLLEVAGGSVLLRPDGEPDTRIATASLTCMYLPKPPTTSLGARGAGRPAVRRALRPLCPAPAPRADTGR